MKMRDDDDVSVCRQLRFKSRSTYKAQVNRRRKRKKEIEGREHSHNYIDSSLLVFNDMPTSCPRQSFIHFIRKLIIVFEYLIDDDNDDVS